MKKYKKKYNKGTQKVDVPPTMTGADVGAQALSGAAAGAAMGATLGPWGLAAGTVVGGAVGAAKGLAAKDAAQAANTRALAINNQADKNFRTGIDSKLQNYQYKKGGSVAKTKEIEIEGKKFPEIHTDKNYNIKTLGDTPHSEGGTKTIAEEGDVVFDTQNSESDYKKVMYDIKLYKMKGDKNALKRLEKRRKEMPSDEGQEKQDDGNRGVSVNPYTVKPTVQNTGTQYYNGRLIQNPLFNTQFSGETPATNQGSEVIDPSVTPFNVHDYVKKNPASQYDFNETNSVVDPVQQNTNLPTQQNIEYTGPNSTTNWGNTNFSGNKGYDPTTDKFNPVNSEQTFNIVGEDRMDTNTAVTPKLNAVPTNSTTRQPKQLGNVGRYANIAYNAVQAFNKPQKTLERDLQLNRYKYSDMSDPLREAARQNRATSLYNAGRAGSSIGQQLSYAQQGQNNYISQLGQINAGENERKQNIQNANVDLSNQENQVNYERAYQNNDISAKRRAAQQSYGAAAASEATNLAEVQKQEQLQRLAEQHKSDRDKQYLDLLGSNNYGYDENLKTYYKRTYPEKQSKGNSGIKTRYVYKSSTKTKK